MSKPFFSLLFLVVLLSIQTYIRCIVLAIEETTVTTQKVSHNRPIKCQSRSWSQKGTKVNGSHHDNSPLLKATGIQSRQNPCHVQPTVNVLYCIFNQSHPWKSARFSGSCLPAFFSSKLCRKTRSLLGQSLWENGTRNLQHINVLIYVLETIQQTIDMCSRFLTAVMDHTENGACRALSLFLFRPSISHPSRFLK